GAKPYLKGSLDVEQLDLNPYLPPEQEAGGGAGAAAPPQEGGGGWSEEPIDLSGLNAVDADFALSVGGIQVRKIKIGKGVVNAQLKDGKLVTDLSELALYQGAGQGRMVLDGAGD